MEPTQEQATASEEAGAPKILAMRRQPCPCGSGKKFKNCHIDDPAYEVAAEPAAATAIAPAATGKAQPPGVGDKHFPMQNQKSAHSQRFSNATHRRKV